MEKGLHLSVKLEADRIIFLNILKHMTRKVRLISLQICATVLICKNCLPSRVVIRIKFSKSVTLYHLKLCYKMLEIHIEKVDRNKVTSSGFHSKHLNALLYSISFNELHEFRF